MNATIPLNPTLPKQFDCTDNDQRPASHMKWWGRPYITTEDGAFCPRERLGSTGTDKQI